MQPDLSPTQKGTFINLFYWRSQTHSVSKDGKLSWSLSFSTMRSPQNQQWTTKKNTGSPRFCQSWMWSLLPSLKLTQLLKMDGWNTTFLLGRPIFRGYVSFREGSPSLSVDNGDQTFWVPPNWWFHLRWHPLSERACAPAWNQEEFWNIWVFPKIGVSPQNGWFIMENPIKMDDLGVALFLETPILGSG